MAVLLIGEDYEGNRAVFRGERGALINAAWAIAYKELSDQKARDKRMLERDSFGIEPNELPNIVINDNKPFFELSVRYWYVRVADEAPVLTLDNLESYIESQYGRR